MDADVIVVGGGPGGAMAARALAQAGVRVLLLEKARFPRHKPCGGSLSPKVLSFDVDFKEVVEDVVMEATFTAPGEAPIEYRAESPLAYMVRRERFDQLLLNRAQEAGVRALFGHRVLRVKEISEGVEVFSERGPFRAPVLVGADGAHGAVTRSLSLSLSRIALAMDARISLPNDAQDAWNGRVLIDFGAIPFGYGWVFPKAREVSTGVLGVKKKIRGLPGHLDRFLSQHESLVGTRRVSGWPIPLPTWSLKSVATSRVVLVGDAAGLVDPFTGEGIYYAMASGLLAAKAILDTGAEVAEQYRALIRETFEREFRSAAILAGIIHRAPLWSFRALKRHPEAIQAFADVLRGDVSYRTFLWKVARRCLFHGVRKRKLAA